jgi:enoyl-CoA hydratase
MAYTYKTLKYEIKNGVAIITLDDAEKKNAISFCTLDELESVLDRVESDESVRALLLYGTEKYFCAGGSLNDMNGLQTGQEVYLSAKKTHHVYDRIEGLRIPTVAAIAGVAMGGGMEIALACDMRVANTEVKLALSESTLGLMPGGGGTQRLPRVIGVGRALEILMTGRIVRAEEALQMGLVNKIVPAGSVYQEGMQLAEVLAKRATASLSLIKKAVSGGYGAPASVGMEIEARCFEAVFATQDAREGIQAFLEKRPSNYIGK